MLFEKSQFLRRVERICVSLALTAAKLLQIRVSQNPPSFQSHDILGQEIHCCGHLFFAFRRVGNIPGLEDVPPHL